MESYFDVYFKGFGMYKIKRGNQNQDYHGESFGLNKELALFKESNKHPSTTGSPGVIG